MTNFFDFFWKIFLDPWVLTLVNKNTHQKGPIIFGRKRETNYVGDFIRTAVSNPH
jgi:hypothetical protein